MGVRSTCLLDEFVATVPWMTTPKLRGPSCRDFLDLCTCTRPPNLAPEDYSPQCTNDEGLLSSTPDLIRPWIEMLRGLCPGTCGICTYKHQNAGNASTGLRLNSSDRYDFADDGIDERKSL